MQENSDGLSNERHDTLCDSLLLFCFSHTNGRQVTFVCAGPRQCKYRNEFLLHIVILYISTTIIHGFIFLYVMFWSVSISDPNNLDMVHPDTLSYTPTVQVYIYKYLCVYTYIYISEYIHILYIYIHSILYIPCHEISGKTHRWISRRLDRHHLMMVLDLWWSKQRWFFSVEKKGREVEGPKQPFFFWHF